MAARSPSSFNQYNDETVLYPRQEIITTVPSAVVDDQQFCLEVERLMLADVYPPFSTTAAVLTPASGIYYLNYKLAGTTQHTAKTVASTVLCWASDASDFTVRVSGIFANADFAVTANHTDKIWRAFDATDVLATAVEPQQIQLEARRDAGSGTIYVAGVAIFSA
jgi:hypothetical protein